jgi:hypothetical protein
MRYTSTKTSCALNIAAYFKNDNVIGVTCGAHRGASNMQPSALPTSHLRCSIHTPLPARRPLNSDVWILHKGLYLTQDPPSGA